MGRLAGFAAGVMKWSCGMGNVGPWVFDDVLQGIADIGQDWQVVIGHARSRDLVTLHVEVDDMSRHNAIETRIHNNLRERFPDFWRNREMQLFELRVVVHELASLRGDARKLRRVVDERLMSHTPSVVSA
jgi:phenylacetate-coenzyme A ligase PaaK-like adenylate-forming protein